MAVLELTTPARKQPRSTTPEAPASAGEHEHPPAAHTELATMSDEGIEDVDAEYQQRDTDEALHDGVERGRQVGCQNDGGQTEPEDHHGVPGGIEGGEEHRA